MILDGTNHEESESENNENPAKRRRSTKLPKCLDGKYFVIQNWKSDVNIEAKCILCHKNEKFISAAINGTANLSRHIKTSHVEELESFNKHINNKKSLNTLDHMKIEAENSESLVSNSTNSSSSVENALKIFFLFLQLKSLVLNYIVDANAPLSVVRLDSFQALIRCATNQSVQIPSTIYCQ